MEQVLYKNRFNKIYTDIYTVGTTDRNEYIPVYALLESNRRLGYNKDFDITSFSNLIIDNVFMYNKPVYYTGRGSYGVSTAIRTMPNLLQAFIYYQGNSVYRFKVGEELVYVSVTGGCLMDTEGNILLMLCCKASEITYTIDEYDKKYLNTDSVIENDVYKTDNLRVMVSTEFIKNPKYKNFYKKVEKEILQTFYNLDVEVVFTTSTKIEQSLFKNDFEVSFNTLEELNETLNSGIGNILFQPEIETIPVEVNPIEEANPIVNSSTQGIQANERWSLTNRENYIMGFDPISSESQSNFVIQGGREIIQNFHNVMEQSVVQNYGNITRTEMDSVLNAIAPDYSEAIQRIEEVEQPTDEQVNGNQEDELPF